MENDVVAILGPPNIHFDPFKPMVNRQLNRRQCILRCGATDSTMDKELNRTWGKNGPEEICAHEWRFARDKRLPEAD